MWPDYEELDFQQTELGELLLRRRRPIRMPDIWVYEVKLDNRFLMSSLVHDSEDALAQLSLERLDGEELRIVIGGLGLGHTAAAALVSSRVAAIDVVELLPQVIDWHQRDLVPLAATLRGDERCRLVQADCFDWVLQGRGGIYDAVLIDVDDSPEHLLRPDHGSFYTDAGLTGVRRSVRPGGVLALWTAGEVLPEFLLRMRGLFEAVDAVPVEFHNPLHSYDDVNTIYLARA